ncbi:hypothetical protein ACHAW6_004957 [Cyclotella cf. meneghiniana]
MASIPTTLVGENCGHRGMIVDKTKYMAFLNGGAKFELPKNTGKYPTTLDENNAAMHEKQVESTKN